MDHRKDVRDVRDFLVSRRARVSPEQAGLPNYGSNRRMPFQETWSRRMAGRQGWCSPPARGSEPILED